MKPIKIFNIVLLLAFLVLLNTACCCCSDSSWKSIDRPRPSSYNTGPTYEDAISANKPVIVYFYSDFCGACTTTAPIFADIRSEYQDKASFVMLNPDTHGYLFREYNVNSYPTVYIINPDSKYREKIPYREITTNDSFKAYLEKNLEEFRPQKKVMLY